ncbi:hypothetical protein [Silvimonas amylolytica]|uniref:Lipoprotein n=1 Tax=Silvimonas amylolytica TaxID=449663 RepID=A0ABQ2PQZ1_9NEIS|nr:hypothetical protein [Silvimonas amylolytica]GGP27713.1 hypothetical protein GCM10010971_35320 [Silvimonas amylolytica]
MKLQLLAIALMATVFSGCSVVTTTVAVGAAAVNVAATTVNVATTTAGVAWDVGKAGVNGASWAIDKATAAPAAAPAQTATVHVTEPVATP